MILSLAAALPAHAAPSVSSEAFELHKRGQHESAARTGLNDLLSQPWNHQLRLIVADSLQRLGRNEEAITQLEALDGTPFSEVARVRLQTLRGVQTPPARDASAAPGATSAPAAAAMPLPSSTQVRSRYVSPSAKPAQPAPAQRPEQARYVPQAAASVVPAAPASALAAASAEQSAQAPLAAATARSPAAQRVLDLSAAEQYQQAGTEGLALLTREQADEEVRLAIANSLAWTGRTAEAIEVYKGLMDGSQASAARVGMANAYRWRGRDDLSLALYQQVLATEPGNESAAEGLALARRELRPRTRVSVGRFRDSSDVERDHVALNHRWRDRNMIDVYEIETARRIDTLPAVEASQSEVTMRYHAASLALKPSFELTLTPGGGPSAFGSVRVHPGESDTFVELGRVNWGAIATNPNALRAGLSANHLGLGSAGQTAYGALAGRLDYHDISDGNTILSGTVRLSTNWRPLGPKLRPFVGFEFREAKFSSPNYWSPAEGYGSLYAGLAGDWSARNWNLYASAQAGVRAYGDAGTSWAVAAGGKRWLTEDIGLGVDLWSMASQRNNSAYRANTLNVSLETLW